MSAEPNIARENTFRFAAVHSISNSSITEKFVEQKRKYFPNYKRKREKRINWNLISGDFDSLSGKDERLYIVEVNEQWEIRIRVIWLFA